MKNHFLNAIVDAERNQLDRKREAMGVRSEKSAGVAMKASLERFSFEGLGLQFYFSFQTPICASLAAATFCVSSERI